MELFALKVMRELNRQSSVLHITILYYYTIHLNVSLSIYIYIYHTNWPYCKLQHLYDPKRNIQVFIMDAINLMIQKGPLQVFSAIKLSFQV